jgi:hypothetical protein
MRTGGAVTFASAAALTLGRYTVPVYEIYKVGNDPYWLEGLDVLGEIGLNVAVIPHYDNAEGGHHDTRFCYMGERRLAILEEQLPADAHVIGVDEHTGVILDLDSNTATVVGNSTITVRIKGRSTIHNAGDVISIDALRDPATGATICKQNLRKTRHRSPTTRKMPNGPSIKQCLLAMPPVQHGRSLRLNQRSTRGQPILCKAKKWIMPMPLYDQ